MQNKPVTFLNLPEYPGGKEQFKQFVKEHLRYPKQALEKKVEGIVFLSAEVTGRGEVQNIKVEKGIGYGCDEEAARVLSLMKFGGVTNRGVRVKTRKKFRINFTLPKTRKQSYSYTYKKEEVNNQKAKQKKPMVYSYKVNIGPQ